MSCTSTTRGRLRCSEEKPPVGCPCFQSFIFNPQTWEWYFILQPSARKKISVFIKMSKLSFKKGVNDYQ